MVISKAIERADARKPNAFSTEEKLEWLAALEGRIAAEIFLMSPTEIAELLENEAESTSSELLVEAPYDDVYVLWLTAKIDEANGEYDKYTNSLQFFNDHYKSFVNWFIYMFEPAQGYAEEQPRRHDGQDPPYYITAYGLAVKHGYEGTEAEWLNEIEHYNREAAGDAEESATLAESYAKGGTESRAGEDTDNALYYMNQAAGSASNAANSATAAAGSAGAAGGQASAAAASATNADNRAKDAEAWAVGTRNGTNVGSDDPTYHNNAKHYRDQAAQSASDANTKAGEASGSASAAAGSASGAAGSAVLAESYAKGGTGSRAGEDADNALHYKGQAANSASAAAGSATGAAGSADDAEAWAVGQIDGTDVPSSDPRYHNNAKHYKEQAASSAQEASSAKTDIQDSINGVSQEATAQDILDALEGIGEQLPDILQGMVEAQEAAEAAAGTAEDSAEDAEAYATGKRNGADVSGGDPAYHNNADYYRTLAAGSATAAAGSATEAQSYAKGGTSSRTGEDTDNAKYYSEQASGANTEVQSAKTDIQNSINGVAQEATAQSILTRLGLILPVLEEIAEQGQDAGSLNGFGLELDTDNGVILTYSDPQTGIEAARAKLPTDNTGMEIVAALQAINRALEDQQEE